MVQDMHVEAFPHRVMVPFDNPKRQTSSTMYNLQGMYYWCIKNLSSAGDNWWYMSDHKHVVFLFKTQEDLVWFKLQCL